MVTQIIRNQYNEIQIGNFCQFGVRKKTNTGGDEIPSNEMHFTTTEGTIDYSGAVGDVITFSDGATYTVLEDGTFSSENVPAGKHVVKLVESIDRSNYVSVGGEALVELHNFPTLSSVDTFDTYSSPNLVKVPTVLPSNITGLDSMFFGATSFNQDISMWDTSNVNSMYDMFGKAIAFNQPLNSWDVSNVTNMSFMFNNAIAFNQPLSSWNVSNVDSMRGMFDNAIAFNQPLNSWNVSNVTDMFTMFRYAINFNQDISMWNVSSVTDMGYMFCDASTFNQDLSQWCVSNIINPPTTFDSGATSWTLPRPVWGTCPA